MQSTRRKRTRLQRAANNDRIFYAVFRENMDVWIGIWNVVDKLPICGITSTNGDGGLVQATLEAMVVASAVSLSRSFHALWDCSGGGRIIFVCSCGRQDACELIRVVTPSSWIRWDEGWLKSALLYEITDNLEHGGFFVHIWPPAKRCGI